MAFSFPYPVKAVTPRPPGQGCLACVHRGYCPAIYWFRRYIQEGRTIDNHMGVQCASWSSNMADQVITPPTETDLDEEYYMTLQGITSEADRCGLTDAVTASNREP